MNRSCHSNQINDILQTLKEADAEGRDTVHRALRLTQLKEKLKTSEISTFIQANILQAAILVGLF